MLSKQQLNPHDCAVPPPKRMGPGAILPSVPHFNKGGPGAIFPIVPHFNKGGLGGILFLLTLLTLAGPAVADVQLVAVPSTQSACIGQNFDITIQKQSTDTVDGIDLFLNFDSATLQVNSITNNSTLDAEMKNTINTGNLNFSAVSFANAPPSGNFDFITLNVTPLAASAGTALQFDTNNSTVTYSGSYLNYTADDLTVAIDQTCPCSNVTQIPLAQCETLVALYDSTDGDNWTNNTDWKQTNTPCSWHGVTCNNGDVTELKLNSNRLIGTLPNLSALTSLQKLDLSYTGLTGTVPDFSALTNLQSLNLCANSLTGSIPDFSALTKLQELMLCYNHFTGTVPNFTALTSLEQLNLFSNQFTGTIPDFSTLTNLQYLSLNNNQLSGTIPDFSLLTNLQYLSLNNNQLSGTIPDFSLLTNLQSLRLSNNQLSGTIPDFSTLTNLQSLWVDNNQLMGPIPSFSPLIKLQQLNIDNNTELCKAPNADYGKWTTKVINLAECSFSCDIAQMQKNQCETLVALYDSTNGDNWLSNTGWKQTNTPCSWHGITCSGGQVSRIYLQSNQLTGTFPDLSALTQLKHLYFHDNQFTGSVPDLSVLTELTYLRLDDNRFTGTIPDLSALTKLLYVNLYNNQLTGSLPELSALTQLETFGAGNNQLSGPVPDLSALTQLKTLYLYDNDFTGPIPDFSALTQLEDLRLFTNQLTGTIPDLSRLTNLERLYLADNQLTGTIPDVSNLTNLQLLYLQENQLTGSIPELSALTQLKYLYLHSNRLSGPIPDLSALTQLMYLQLSDNELTGPIPDLSALTKLQRVYLSKNQLTGPIPDVSRATNLEYLYLQENDLSGEIPSWLNTLTNLDRLYLNNNGFTGEIPAFNALTRLKNLTLSNNLELCKGPTTDYGKWTDTVSSFAACPVNICDTAVQMQKNQCETLVALYDSTGGDNWTNNTDWNTTNTPCSWHGITCSDDVVTSINLPDNNLTGSLPDLSALTGLEQLLLYSNELEPSQTPNQLTGNIPDLNALTELKIFQLSGNQLAGSIPDLSGLTKLQILSLNHNQLTGTIPDVSALTELRIFHIADNQLTGTLPNLSSLTDLEKIWLSNNQLTGTIPELSGLSKLSNLNLANNQLNGAIPDLSDLTSLQNLTVSNNTQLCTNSDTDYGNLDVSAFSTCEFLDLFWLDSYAPEAPAETTGSFVLENGVSYLVQVKGSISVWSPAWETDGYCGTPEDSPLYPSPNKQNSAVGLDNEYGFSGPSDEDWICGGNMPMDRTDSRISVDGGNTWFTPTPLNSAYNPEHVYSYQVTGQGHALQAQFTDPSPSDNYGRFEIQVLPTTTTCSTVTEIPTAQCETLVALYDSTNGDNWTNNTGWKIGNTPCSWFGVSCNNGVVTEIKMPDNNLIGTLPDLSALTGLEHLALYSAVDEEKKSQTPNQLTGNIPELSALTNLKVLWLVGNQLEGPIPDLSGLIQLRFLALGANKLSGQIPESVSTLTNLNFLHLPVNQLTGTVPDLSALTKLQHLSLHQNKLTGTIPDLKEQTQLKYFSLSANQVSGTIPESIGTLTNLTALHLAHNQLTGTIPDLSALTKLENIHLHLNQLTGEFPDVSGAGNLQDISVADNSLSGELPSWLNTLTNLEKLHLHDNEFTGEIPDLSQLSQLQILKLQDNQLSGAIPDLAQFSALEELALTNNQLCQEGNADYGNWTQVNEFPDCAEVKLIAEASTTNACIGQNLTITVNKKLAQSVNEIQMALNYEANLFKINSITNAGPLSQFSETHANGTAQITAGHFTGVSDDFAIASLQLIPLAASVGTSLQFNDSQTVVKLSGTPLRHESQGITLAIKDCVSDIVIQPEDNSAIWTLVEETQAVEQTGANLDAPKSLSFDASGNAYIADSLNHRILKRDTQGNLTVVAGTGKRGNTGDDGPAIEAKLNNPQGVAVDQEGNLYIADTNNHRIRKVDSNGIITTVVGIGKGGYAGDKGLATAAKLRKPTAIVFDNNGHLYIADSGNHRIRKVSGQRTRKPNANSIITTVAGSGRGYRGDNGPATGARLNNPTGLAVDGQNNLYIADTGNHRIRKVDLTGTITTVAGNGINGYSGDGGQGTDAKINAPTGLEVDSTGNLYIADRNNHRIRKVDNEGIITTFTGTGKRGTSTDGILAGVAQISQPSDVALDQYGNLYIADKGNNSIRKIGEQDGEDGAAPPHQIADCPNTEVTGISENECYALIALYDSTKGPEWTNNDGWKATDTPCQWTGVTCANGSVTEINLPNNNLVGDIPVQIGALINLEELNLNDNQISGAIPTTIEHLNNLETLNLENNALTGSLPQELGDATNLQTVNLATNQISGAIPDLNALTQLQTLNLSENLLSGPVPDLTALTTLQTLEISGEDQQVCRDSDIDYGNMPVGNLDECPTDNQLPTAAFTATPNKGTAPLTVNLDARSSHDPFGNITAYFWETSDGTVLTGATPSITFTKSGTYEIKLRVMDHDGAPSINVATHLIEVNPGPDQVTLNLDKDGMGLGSITARRDKEPATTCNTKCQTDNQDYPQGSEIKLTARAAKGSLFTGWRGDCVGTEENNRIKVTMDSAKQCTAVFELEATPPPQMHALTIDSVAAEFGSGGNVKVNDVSCETPPCKSYHQQGRNVKITGVPIPHAYFMSWNQSCPVQGTFQDATNLVALTSETTCVAYFGNDSVPNSENIAKDFEEVGELSTGESVSEMYPEVDNHNRYKLAFLVAEKAMMTAETQMIIPGEESWPDQFDEVQDFFKLPDNLWVKKVRIVATEEDIGRFHITGQYVRVDVLLLNKYGREDLVPILIYYQDKPTIEETAPPPMEENNTRRAVRYGGCCRPVRFRRPWRRR